MKTLSTHAGAAHWGRRGRTRWLLVVLLSPLLALTATLAQAHAQSAWVAVPHMPTARNGLGGTSAPCPKGVEGLRGTCVYAIGGQNANSPALGTVEAYSPATNTWRSLPQLPTPRYAVTATTAPCPQAVRGLAGTCVYAIGGFTGTQWPDPAHDVGTVEAYSPATNTWRTLPQLPTTRSFAAATTAPCPPAVAGLRGSCVYAVGGALSATVEAYSPVTNVWRSLPSLQTRRDAPGAATAPCPRAVADLRGACVYAVGGFNPTDGVLDSVEAYSPATNSWHTVAAMDAPRVALGATSAPCPTAAGKAGATCVHAIAGFTNFTDFATDTAEFFTPAANDWSPLPDLATARFEPAAATAPCPKSAKSVRTCMYALGGLNDTSFTALNSVEALPVGR